MLKKIGLVILIVLLVLLFVPLTGKIRLDRWVSDYNDVGPYKFPKGFYWGTAVASQHVESQSPSDWTAFENSVISEKKTKTDPRPGYAVPGHINSHDKFSERIRRLKVNFDAMYDQDFANARAMGNNAFRFSFSWSRLFPANSKKPTRAGVAYYRKMLASLKKNQLTPFATLFHFSSPQWFWKELNGKKGWEREDALEHFETYVRALLDNFGSEIVNWCTLNEPMVFVFNGYMEGVFPPLEQRKDVKDVAPVIKKLLQAHALAYRLIHEYGKKNNIAMSVGITKHTRAFEPMRNWAILDRLSAAAVEQAFIWDFLDAMHTGRLKLLNTDVDEEIPGLKDTQDYVGINYYGRFYVKSDISNITQPQIVFHDKDKSNEIKNDLDWAIYPYGFSQVLLAAHKKYNKPIFVLENGMADAPLDDLRRQSFLVTHVKEIYNVMKHHGADIRGYMHWSLIDNFEWAEGFTARFGLFKVNYDNNFKRTARRSVDVYRKIAESNQISEELWLQYSPRSYSLKTP